MSDVPPVPSAPNHARRSIGARVALDKGFYFVCLFAITLSILILLALLGTVVRDGIGSITPTLITGAPNSDPAKAGIFPLMMGTTWVCLACAIFTLPIGVATAVYLEEFRPKQLWLRQLHGFIQLNIQNLAGVPSIVYGILGLTAFVSMFGLFGANPSEPMWEFGVAFYDQFEAADGDVTTGKQPSIILVPVKSRYAPETVLETGLSALNVYGEPIDVQVLKPGESLPSDPEVAANYVKADASVSREPRPRWYYIRLPFGRSVMAGALTLMLVILPLVIISSQEALRGVPSSLREGSLGMGATPIQTVWHITLPAAVPGIMTGAILAMSRAIGEAAPIMIVAGAIVNKSGAPQNLMDGFSIMPIQIYSWTEESNQGFHPLAAGSIILLLLVLLVFNGVAVFIRHRLQKNFS